MRGIRCICVMEFTISYSSQEITLRGGTVFLREMGEIGTVCPVRPNNVLVPEMQYFGNFYSF